MKVRSEWVVDLSIEQSAEDRVNLSLTLAQAKSLRDHLNHVLGESKAEYAVTTNTDTNFRVDPPQEFVD